MSHPKTLWSCSCRQRQTQAVSSTPLLRHFQQTLGMGGGISVKRKEMRGEEGGEEEERRREGGGEE